MEDKITSDEDSHYLNIDKIIYCYFFINHFDKKKQISLHTSLY